MISVLLLYLKAYHHICNDTTRVKNVEELISKSSVEVKNQIISSTLENETCFKKEKKCRSNGYVENL